MNAPAPPPAARDRRQPGDVHAAPGATRIALELIAAFVLLVLADQAFGGGHGFAGVDPHPYWLPVLLAAILYGTGPGLAAAGIASLLWLWLARQPFAPGQDYFVHVFAIARLPLLWTIAALGLGEIALFRMRRLEKAIRREAKHARQVDTLSRRYRRLNAINRDLQLRIATEQRTVPHAVAQALALFDGRDPAEPLAALVALVSGSDAFTLYALDDGGARPLLTRGPAPVATPGAVLVAAIRAHDAPLHVGRPADRPLLGGLGLCAVAVRPDADGPATGLLLFHDLPADRLTDAGIAGLGAIGDWLGRVGPRAGTAAVPA